MNRKLLLVPAILLVVAPLSGCGDKDNVTSKAETTNSDTSKGDVVSSADYSAAAKTVNDFFNTTIKVGDSLNDKIDAQSVYLTSREVHPTLLYVKAGDDTNLGVNENKVKTNLSKPILVGDKIKIRFASLTESTSYPTMGGKVLMDEGGPSYSVWGGTATLEKVDGKWLISNLTQDNIAGGLGETPKGVDLNP